MTNQNESLFSAKPIATDVSVHSVTAVTPPSSSELPWQCAGMSAAVGSAAPPGPRKCSEERGSPKAPRPTDAPSLRQQPAQ